MPADTDIKNFNQTETAFQQFQKIAAKWIPYMDFMRVSAVGIKVGDRTLLTSGAISIYRAGLTTEPDFNIETENLYIRKRFFQCDADRMHQFLQEAYLGRILIPGCREFEMEPPYETHSFPINIPGGNGDIRFPHCFILSGGERFGRPVAAIGGLERLNWELRSHDPPHYNLDQIHRFFGHPLATAFHRARIEISIVPPALISADRSYIRDGKSTVVLSLSPRLNPADVAVTSNGLSGEGLPPSNRLESTATAVPNELHFECESPGLAATQIFLNVLNDAVHQFWIVDPEKRLYLGLTAYEVFDESRRGLDERLLNTRETKEDQFEWAIGILFYLLGFSVCQLGRGVATTDGPDIIAITPLSSVAIVECTTGHPDNKDKTAKLLQRAARLRERLDNSGFQGNKVMPILVTALPREELTDVRASVFRRGAFLVDRTTLSELKNRVIVPPNADQLFYDAFAQLEIAKTSNDPVGPAGAS